MRRSAYLSAVVPFAVHACFVVPNALAQQDVASTIDEIIVTGTRRTDRTVSESPVPVDVFRGDELRNMGTGDIDNILRTLIASYNVTRFPLDDEASLVRPATLRGLPPDYSLTLINGKRRHRSGVIFGPIHGPDLAAIPAMAIERVELLRDGAAAQYGSDAIAGILNFITRSSSEGITAEIETGQFYAGDGHARRFSGNAGIPLGDTGFLNLSLEYGDQETTSRAIQRPDAAALEAVGADGIPNPVQNWGQPSVDDEVKLFVNAAIGLGGNAELYGFGNFSERTVELEFFWRHINGQNGIYTSGNDRLVFDLTADGSGNCPLPGSPQAIPAPHPVSLTQAEYDADVVALQSLAADPNCWVVNELYPSGYKPVYGADMRDVSAVVGLRGGFDNGLMYDFSVYFGENGADYALRESINASLGPASPTSFGPGQTIQSDTNLNADFVLPVDVTAYASPLNVAFGFEWREESFEIVAGNRPSWEAGLLAAQGASIGSNGFPGYAPEHAGKWDRSNIALYLDLEADVTDSLTLGAAGRYEDFDDFGSTTNGKLAFRYRFTDLIGVRGSVSTGFKAPTPGLSNVTKTSTFFVQGAFQQIGLVPSTNPVAVFYGGKPLESEDSRNISAGITFDPAEYLRVTFDYYDIEIENGISIGQFFGVTPEDRAELIALGVPGASDFAAIQFYGNEISANTRGFDLVASYVVDSGNGGVTDFSLSFTDNRAEISFAGVDPPRNGIVGEENAMRYRGILSATHLWNDLRISARASYYDGWVDPDFSDGPLHPVCSDERPSPMDTDACYGDAWVFDVEMAYTFSDRFTLTAGADNVLDTFPDKHFRYPDRSGGTIYPISSPLDYQGGFWYLRLRADF